MIVAQVAGLSLQGLHVDRAGVVHYLGVVVGPAVVAGVVVRVAVIRHGEVAGRRAIFRVGSSSSGWCGLIGGGLVRTDSSMGSRLWEVVNMSIEPGIGLVVKSVLRVGAIGWVRTVGRVRAVSWVGAVTCVRSELRVRSSRSIHVGISVPGRHGVLSDVVTRAGMWHMRVVVMDKMVFLSVHISKLIHMVLMILVDRRVRSSMLGLETCLALFVLIIKERLDVHILLHHLVNWVRLLGNFLSSFVLLHVPVLGMLVIGIVHIMLLLVVTVAGMLMIRGSL